MRLLGDQVDLLKRCKLVNCESEVMTCEMADAQGDTTDMVTVLHQHTVYSYGFARREVGGALTESNRRLEKAFNCER